MELALPRSGAVYVDSNCIICAVENVPPHADVLAGLWKASSAGNLVVFSSELAVCETLVKPIREGKRILEAAFRAFLLGSREFQVVPISLSILERAAKLRADTGLKTPDAVHAATAMENSAALFVTNDPCFRRVAGLPLVVLGELV